MVRKGLVQWTGPWATLRLIKVRERHLTYIKRYNSQFRIKKLLIREFLVDEFLAIGYLSLFLIHQWGSPIYFVIEKNSPPKHSADLFILILESQTMILFSTSTSWYTSKSNLIFGFHGRWLVTSWQIVVKVSPERNPGNLAYLLIPLNFSLTFPHILLNFPIYKSLSWSIFDTSW